MNAVQHSDTPILVNIRDAARMLSLSERTVFTLKARGDLPFVKIGRALRFRVADLTKWADAQSAKTSEPNWVRSSNANACEHG